MIPHLLVIVGPNGSGKSSLINNTDLNWAEKSIINPDNYARNLPNEIDEYNRYVIAMNQCAEVRESLLSNKASFGFETVGSREDKLEFIRKAKESGYVITLVFVTTNNPDINIKRIAERVKLGGHSVPEEKVRSRYERTMRNLPMYLDLADEAMVLDNSGCEPSIILTKKDGCVSGLSEAPEWIVKYFC